MSFRPVNPWISQIAKYDRKLAFFHGAPLSGSMCNFLAINLDAIALAVRHDFIVSFKKLGIMSDDFIAPKLD